jgi:hypothetical protein
MSDINSLFSVSVVSANVRANNLGLKIGELLSNCFTEGFGFSDNIGQSLYQQIKNSKTISNTLGMNVGSTYDSIEGNLLNFLRSNFSQSDSYNKNFAIALNAILFSWSIFPDVLSVNVSNLIPKVLANVAQIINKFQIFNVASDGSVSDTIFTVQVVESLLQNNNYAQVLSDVSKSPKDTKSNIVNYNWYDVANLFTNPNLQIMKDVENQYYYISGQLIYQSLDMTVGQCIDKEIVINTISGYVTGKYIYNQPCIDDGQYIGPITGVGFYRIFNDGPSSIGDFNSSVEKQYIEWDKQILNPKDYSSNVTTLFSFETGTNSGFIPLSNTSVTLAPNGLYNIPNTEYNSIQDGYDCVGFYQRMHIGDNRPRAYGLRDIHNICTGYQIRPKTGFKFVTLKLNDSWGDNFSYIKTNPVSNTQDFLKRGLNIQEKAYLSSLDANGIFYTDLGVDNSDQDHTYLGPPQLTGNNILPSLAFFQEFLSPTFGDVSRLTFYPAIGTSYGGNSVDSDRTFNISTGKFFSGSQSNNIPLKFNQNFNSTSLTDDISKTFFGMGDGFNNQYEIIAAECQNAGYFYTGYYLIDNSGNITNIVSLSNNGVELIGNPPQYINYINGYTDSGANNFSVSQMIAQDSSGNLVNYYYLDNRNLRGIETIPQNNWSNFSPLPDAFETNTGYGRIIVKQQVENYLPRYKTGPFSTETKTFLYPNASVADIAYNSKQVGFPKKIRFSLTIKEETIREVYGYYRINNNGIISTNPVNVPVIRASSSGTQYSYDYMNDFFIPDNPNFNLKYDFNNFTGGHFEYDAPINLVDNYWSPLVFSQLPSGKNNNLYNVAGGENNGKFSNNFGKNINNGNFETVNGVRITGDGINSTTFWTGSGFQQGPKTIYWEKSKNDGLWHYFNNKIITGFLEYNKPVFDLSSGEIYINQEIQDSFYNLFNQFGSSNWDGCSFANNLDSCGQFFNTPFIDIHGYSGLIKSGFDPYSLQYIGGRSGGLLINQEGGYNTKQIIGDAWSNFSYDFYGIISNFSEEFAPPCGPVWRWPYYDKNIILINANKDITNILTRGMNYSPFNISKIPFLSFDLQTPNYNYKLGNTNGALILSISGDYASFDLNTYMPAKNTLSGLYDTTGLIIGPFDRDIEIGVVKGNQLMANADIYCQNNPVSFYTTLNTYCDIYAQNFGKQQMDSGIFPGKSPGRDSNFTIINIIPSGQSATFNLSGVSGLIGWSGASILSFRPRKMIGQSQYDSNIHFGEQNWINNLAFLNNGIEQTFTLSNGGSFENLEDKSFSFTNYGNSGKLYPQPNSDFTGMGHFDKFGNLIYPKNATVENYWKNWAFSNKSGINISGVREGSRISFTFTDIEVLYDVMPYQGEPIITPSGNCIISGEMGYYAQADNSIYTEGALLVDTTDPIQGDFNEYKPYYLSDVLKRLSFLVIPSGQVNSPVLPFPSVMEQRQYISGIFTGQTYNKILNYPPDNYNKFIWPALSDLETLNPGETIEKIPPNDSLTFTNSSALFSASQGQALPNGLKNPLIVKQFDVSGQYQFYDSIATDALINSGTCITNNRGSISRINTGELTGVLTPENTTISMILAGFV